MKKLSAVCLLALLLVACDSGDSQQVYILQQQGVFRPAWDDVILVYGFSDNYTEAKKIADYYTSTYEGRSYRLVSKTISRREYEKMQKRLQIK